MEVWKEIENYEGLYEVSSLGEVQSLDRIDPAGRKRKSNILKQATNNVGYKYVKLCKCGKYENKLIHRLVAKAFIENPNNLPQAGHMNDIKIDNNINNLYWTDAKENHMHNGLNLKVSKKIRGTLNDVVVVFSSSMEAGRNGYNASAIRHCLRGAIKTHKGYKWERL